jgi:uncharacterized protein (DUF1330 family)
MNRIGVAALALLVGGVLGAGAMAAQTPTPKAYVIAQLTVHDAKKFMSDYAPKVPAALAGTGGHYIVRSGALIPLEGTPPGERIVVIEFPSIAAARVFEESPAYQAIKPIRQAAATGPVYIVEGVSP